MSYQQLTLDERYQIRAYQRVGFSQAEIARRLDRHPSTISREFRRNSDLAMTTPYEPKRAERLAHDRRRAKGVSARKIRGALQILVEQKLALSWSPEQISGRLRLEGVFDVSHETIYQHVIRDAKRGGFLRYCLRFGGYKHHRCRKSRMAQRTRLRKHWYVDRPAAANNRSELGHWERDTLLGKRGGACILALVDRRSRYTRLRHVENLASDDVARATIAALQGHRRITKTITNDNGVEFQRDEALQRRLRVPIYFTEPSAPWQRGTVENTNLLLRQYLNKGVDLNGLEPWVPAALEQTLNFRPRKTHNYRTPHEVHFNERLRLTSGNLLRFGLEFSAAS